MSTTLATVPARPEQIANDAARTFTDADFPVGSVAHQGDLIFVRLEKVPASTKTRESRQLAEGSTQGSRHILKVGDVFDCNVRDVAREIEEACGPPSVAEQYIGPVFRTCQGKADVLHPEHGNHHYRGNMTIAIVYQRNLDAEERERRVVD